MNQLRPSIPGWILDFVALDAAGVHTTSLKVAEQYHKRHDNVVRAIRNILRVTRNHLDFEEVDYKDAKGESRPMYRITEGGFMKLALGFTGDKAIHLRGQFVDAFRWMARELVMRQVDDFERRARQSIAAGSVGSGLMTRRKREIPALAYEERRLRAELQLGLGLDLFPLP